MGNDFTHKRLATAAVTFPNTAGSVTTGVYIPARAIVTGIRFRAPAAVTITGAQATCQIRLGTDMIVGGAAISDYAAYPHAGTTALSIAGGVYFSDAREFNLVFQASSGSACTATYNYYVDYIYIYD
jgi:hypothetical protein